MYISSRKEKSVAMATYANSVTCSSKLSYVGLG
jgi:hypothetical protein